MAIDMNMQGRRLTTGKKKSPQKNDKSKDRSQERAIGVQETKCRCLPECGACEKHRFLPFRELYFLPDRELVTSRFSICRAN